jgi:hypothetical protein
MKPRRALSTLLFTGVFAALPALGGCGNPVIDVKVAALGGEVPGVEPSEFHRPGQPCLDCHGVYGGASPQMSIAGTIFAAPIDKLPTPVEKVNVVITDSFGNKNGKGPTETPPQRLTNCVGNFFFTRDEFDPGFPLEAKIECPTKPGSADTTGHYMSSRISREGSCAACHTGARDQGSPGWVYCVENPAASPFKPPGSECQGVPK